MALAITIKSPHCCNIVNGIKKGELRKNEDLNNAIEKEIAEKGKATIYVICSKSKPYLNSLEYRGLKWFWLEDKDILGVTENSKKATNGFENGLYDRLNGRVVCKFECEKVEHFEFETVSRDMDGYWFDNGKMLDKETLKLTCLTYDEFFDYIKFGEGAIIHISNLTIFKRPNEIKELKKIGYEDIKSIYEENCITDRNAFENLSDAYSLKEAPQNFCYVEDNL